MAAATADQIQKAERWLSRALDMDQRAVTFRELSREIGCHVHSAKNLLNHYFSSHPTVVPTYLLSGPLLATSTLAATAVATDAPAPASQSLAHMSATQKIRIVDMDQVSDDERNSEADAEEERAEIELEESGENIKVDESEVVVSQEVPRWGVVLVGGESLEDKRKLFVPGQANVHIYALSPAPVKDPAQLLACAIAVRERGNDHNGTRFGAIGGDSMVSASKPMRDGGIDFSASAKPSASKAASNAPKEEMKEVKVERTEQRRSSMKNKRRVVTSDDEDEDPAPSRRAEGSSSQIKTALGPTSSMVRADDQAAMEAMMGMDFDFNEDDESGTAALASVKATQPGRRKVRRVKKSKMEMDDKGYMVTKDYYTDESYSGSETETETAPKLESGNTRADASKPATAAPPKAKAPQAPPAAPKTSKAVGKKGLGQQSTLAGFFKKK